MAAPVSIDHGLQDEAMQMELGELEKESVKKQEVTGDAGIAKLRTALDNRNTQKKDAKAVGASCKSVAKKPSAKAAVLKKPSSKLKHAGNPQPKAASKPKGTVKAKAKATGKEQSNAVKMSRSCVYSRAYHQVSHLWKISF